MTTTKDPRVEHVAWMLSKGERTHELASAVLEYLDALQPPLLGREVTAEAYEPQVGDYVLPLDDEDVVGVVYRRMATAHWQGPNSRLEGRLSLPARATRAVLLVRDGQPVGGNARPTTQERADDAIAEGAPIGRPVGTPAEPAEPAEPERPETDDQDGLHDFTITVDIGPGALMDWTTRATPITVRAASLPSALRQAADVPLDQWMADVLREHEQRHAEPAGEHAAGAPVDAAVIERVIREQVSWWPESSHHRTLQQRMHLDAVVAGLQRLVATEVENLRLERDNLKRRYDHALDERREMYVEIRQLREMRKEAERLRATAAPTTNAGLTMPVHPAAADDDQVVRQIDLPLPEGTRVTVMGLPYTVDNIGRWLSGDRQGSLGTGRDPKILRYVGEGHVRYADKVQRHWCGVIPRTYLEPEPEPAGRWRVGSESPCDVFAPDGTHVATMLGWERARDFLAILNGDEGSNGDAWQYDGGLLRLWGQQLGWVRSGEHLPAVVAALDAQPVERERRHLGDAGRRGNPTIVGGLRQHGEVTADAGQVAAQPESDCTCSTSDAMNLPTDATVLPA